MSIPSVPDEGRSLIELSAGEGQRGLKRRWLKGKTCWERLARGEDARGWLPEAVSNIRPP